MSEKIRVYVATPTTGTIIDSQVAVLREIEETYRDQIELVYPVSCIRRVFHDFARNMMVQDFLAGDCDILWFLDSDITPPKYVLDLITIHGDKWKLAGATYPVFMVPPGGDIMEVVYTAYKVNPVTGNMGVCGVPKSGTDFLDGLATGCLFIRREVLEKMEAPHFEFKYKEHNREIYEGEDLGFCRKVSAMGYKFFVDFSLFCKHQKSVDLHDVNNYAIQYSNRNVRYYDQQIQNTVSRAVQAAYTQGYNARKVEEASKPQLIVPSSSSLAKFSGKAPRR